MEKKLRVLVAEDAPGAVAKALNGFLSESESQLELSTVCTIPTLLATIELAAPEAIFLDLALARPDPMSAVRRVHRAAPGIPFIVVADVAEKHLASRSLSEGAIDYLLKGLMDRRTMERVLRGALERNTLEGLADLLRDGPTGLYNREGFLALGTRAMDASARTGGTLVLLCAMVDNLPSLQREFGSAVADEAVKDTAGVLHASFRRSDLLARLGKAQFGALAVDAVEPSAAILRQRVQARVAALNLNQQPWGFLDLRLSVGYWSPSDTRTFGEFLDSVEAELRHAEVLQPKLIA
jgi:two-component system, cell cycle response regulator